MRNERLKKGLLVILAATAIICFVLAFISPEKKAYAKTVSLEGSVTELTETKYGENDKFVFTAAASFESGNAAGLVFGAEDGAHYWAFYMDRAENRVRLTYNEEGKEPVVVREDYFIGNDKMNDGEKAMVNPKVAALGKVTLKVIVTPEGGKAYAEFYADGIRRFAFDGRGDEVVIDLNDSGVEAGYGGGSTGFASVEAKVSFDEIYSGASDYSYYSEQYRQQYHFSQPAHWNNDPNGLVYYNGYYHIYYQHYPFANVWGDMYWGHARSKDMVHWENLPICLYPDKNVDGRGGDGYMWSGSAMVYRAGTSAVIDGMDWYPNGEGTGLIGFYTRDGQRQDQVIMSSDDGGLTWTKRKLIPQDLVGIADRKVDCRDPKVFPVQYDGANNVIRWGMALTGMGTNDIWFLQSTDLYNWSYAGNFKAEKPECPDVVTLKADDGTTRTVMTFTARQYLVGQLSYSGGKIVFSDLNGKSFADMKINEIPFRKMEFGPDSYATQSFYIDDAESEYYGKSVAVSWFSGVPGHADSIDSGILATVRKDWNGGGMTIPVEYGLVKSGDGYMLTQTPIVKNSDAFSKRSIYSGENVEVTPDTENILKGVNSKNFELEATVVNPDNASVRILVNMNGGEYTEIGWNREEGYYVDRTHSGDAGLKLNNFKRRFVTGPTDEGEQSFYVLSDNGGVEVFCGDFRYPFYLLTFSSPSATGAQFIVDGNVTASVTVNEIATTWRDAETSGTLLYLDCDQLILDKTFNPEREITAYTPYGGQVDWTATGSAVEIEETSAGAKIKAVSAGTAYVTATCGEVERIIAVTVHSGTADADPDFTAEGVVSGSWYETADGILGIQQSGDGFLLSDISAADFTYTANFRLSGAAAALVFRAKADMSDYLIANYDDNGKIVKLWSPRGEIARRGVGGVDTSDIFLKVIAEGNRIRVYINTTLAVDVRLGDSEPKEGLLGLNACAGSVTFKSVALPQDSYSYSEGDLEIDNEAVQTVKTLYNRTAGNVLVPSAFYRTEGRKIILSSEYIATLKTGVYEFALSGAKSSFDFTVDVTRIPSAELKDVTLEYGSNAVIYIGSLKVEQPALNGVKLGEGDYTVKDGVITVSGEKLKAGENTLTLNESASVKITVQQQKTATHEIESDNTTVIIIACSVAGGVIVLGAAAAVTTVLILRRKKSHGGNN